MPIPTGRLVPTDQGYDLTLQRTLPVAIEHAWDYITESQFTERWIGPWEGVGDVGETIKLYLAFEEGKPGFKVEILECQAPEHVRVKTLDDTLPWDLAIELTQPEGQTELQFTMRDADPSTIGEIGPGWEYYLDQLVAIVAGDPAPDFDDYFPAQRSYYEDQRPS
ncbi:SRPBCC domain-containing protein [Enteractinococcus coprophilus]|uniref:Activator of Hsp90 ATPase-like protein n=1 Tax=Enteractinococcus coprophilus TaxID=1027633 RepID=A0A543AIY8_9MICC|nr:SRPBCC domain-containing protein [Enteractinococcus coprophilus]TQL72540.1 activator of Hsp90 ATPase-like protein [Enteractinococcus coprophilus]